MDMKLLAQIDQAEAKSLEMLDAVLATFDDRPSSQAKADFAMWLLEQPDINRLGLCSMIATLAVNRRRDMR